MTNRAKQSGKSTPLQMKTEDYSKISAHIPCDISALNETFAHTLRHIDLDLGE